MLNQTPERKSPSKKNFLVITSTLVSVSILILIILFKDNEYFLNTGFFAFLSKNGIFLLLLLCPLVHLFGHGKSHNHENSDHSDKQNKP